MLPTICLMIFPKDFWVESPLNSALYFAAVVRHIRGLLFEKNPSFSMQTGIINVRSVFSKKGVSIVYCDLLSRMKSFCSKASRTWIDMEKEAVSNPTILPANCTSEVYLSPFFANSKAYPDGFNIQIVDDDNWQISSGLYQAWQRPEANSSLKEGVCSDSLYDEVIHRDCDDIDDMRIRGNLFYKLDRDSKEYEEYSFDFHRKKKPSTKEDNSKHQKKHSLAQNPENKMPPTKENNSKHQKKHLLTNNTEKESRNRFVIPETDNGFRLDEKKRLRTPTFNQVTGPYHEPFCLDIYVSKASVRACIVHRLTSKVVAVAHSISKDMKFDLVSRRDSNACAAVGKVLAQRALTDDIHNLIYTPRKGERIEGKLQTVLQSVINGGINVKVKIKQRRQKKASHPSMASQNSTFR